MRDDLPTKGAVHNPDARQCTCHPDDNPPIPCARKYALRDCRVADVARRMRFVADAMSQGDEAAGALYELARRLDEIV